jgi:hypothetical protein
MFMLTISHPTWTVCFGSRRAGSTLGLRHCICFFYRRQLQPPTQTFVAVDLRPFSASFGDLDAVLANIASFYI